MSTDHAHSIDWWTYLDRDAKAIENFLEDDMTTLDDLVPSQSEYLAKEDVGIAGRDLTISKFTREMVGKNKEERAIIHFREDIKPMVLNKTNKNRIKHYLHASTAEEVIGQLINVYNDPDIEYGGEITGGLRIRGANGTAPDALSGDPDDDIPF